LVDGCAAAAVDDRSSMLPLGMTPSAAAWPGEARAVAATTWDVASDDWQWAWPE